MATRFFRDKIDISQAVTGWNVYDLSPYVDTDTELAVDWFKYPGI